jgi:hypothetical protein
METSSESRYGRSGSQQSLGGNGSQSNDEIRLYGGYLTYQKRKTGFYFIRLGIPVSWRTTFDDIANVNLIAGSFYGRDDAGKKLTGGSNKRFSLTIFFSTRTFADKHQSGVGTSISKYNTVSPPSQIASLTVAQIGLDTLQSLGERFSTFTPLFKFFQDMQGRGEAATPIGS